MDWHRFFGLFLNDFFAGSPFAVELEKDLSLKQQFLDVVILRKRPGPFAGRLPDGLDDLAAHNLITFKSHREALTDWALKELTGHYVNYRKQVRTRRQPLLPESEFRLYAVCGRYPHNLVGAVPWERLGPGVYQCRRGTDVIRVVVAGQLPQAEHNTPLHLLSGSPALVAYGAAHYRPRSPDTSTLLDQLLERYRREGLAVPYTMEEFRREYILEHFKDLTPEQRQKALQGLSPEERQEALQGLPAEERLKGLSPEEIAAYLKRCQQSTPPSPPETPQGSRRKGRGRKR
jgi:hypothetical protein